MQYLLQTGVLILHCTQFAELFFAKRVACVHWRRVVYGLDFLEHGDEDFFICFLVIIQGIVATQMTRELIPIC